MRKDQLQFHLLSHKGKYCFLCYECGKGFNHKGNFEAHKGSHSADKPYKCGRCNKYSTVYPSDLCHHIKTCTVEPHIPCTEPGCKELFSSNDYLQKHLPRKTQERKAISLPDLWQNIAVLVIAKSSYEHTSSKVRIIV